MKEYIKPLAEVVEFEPKDDIMGSDLSAILGAGGEDVEVWN